MKTNTIQGFRNQTKIDLLREALTHIQKAYNIIIDDNLDLTLMLGKIPKITTYISMRG